VSLPSGELEALRRRDPAALRALVDAHTRRLYRAARGMGVGADDADDLVQDVFVTFIDSLDRFEGRASAGTWLFGILLRKVQERRRADQKARQHDSIDEAWEDRFDARGNWVTPPADPARALDAREISQAVRRCLDDLPAAQRDVFVLRHFRELSAADVGEMLALTAGNVGVLLHRARLRLKDCLDRKGWSPAR